MDKKELIAGIIAELRLELESLMKAARAAHSEATHESSKAENKYDTRGLEASYLARGQSRQAAETALAIEEFQKLAVRDFTESDAIDVAALVEVSAKRERNFYFIAPRAGGTEVNVNGTEVFVITPQSPLGQQLVGRKLGDKIKLAIAGTTSEFRIVSVK